MSLNRFDRPGSTILLGIFDEWSLAAWLVLLLLFTVILRLHSGTRHEAALSMLFEQPVKEERKSGFLALAIVSSTIFTLMYKSALMSHLTKPRLRPPLERIEDLEGSGKKVWVLTPSYVGDFVQENYADLVEKGYFVLGSDPYREEVAQGFLEGSLAILEIFEVVLGIYLNPLVNKNLDCKLRRQDLHVAQTSYVPGFLGPVASKNYSLKNEVKLALMRMDQFGFNPDRHPFPVTKSE